MTIPQTRQATVSALPCPPWCRSHDGYDLLLHCSDWRTWPDNNTTDSMDMDVPSFEFQAVRHDMTGRDGVRIGMVDFNIRTDRPDRTDGYLCCDDVRELARWLLALADEFDPHRLNGEPLAWHQPHRRPPLLGLDQ